MRIAITLVLILLLITGCNSGASDGVDEKVIDCIASKSELYVSNGCIACAKQEDILGNGFNKFTVINCKEEPSKCVDKNILAVPTWYIDGNKHVGARSIEELKEFSGC